MLKIARKEFVFFWSELKLLFERFEGEIRIFLLFGKKLKTF